MALSLNKIMLIGNLGKDAETRFTTNNHSVTDFSIATVNSYKGKDGNWVNETTWHNVFMWNVTDYYRDQLKRGKKFYVEGRIVKQEYTDRGGNKNIAVKVCAEKLIPLGDKQKENGGVDTTNGGSTGKEWYDRKGDQEAPPETGSIPDDENDDLPF